MPPRLVADGGSLVVVRPLGLLRGRGHPDLRRARAVSDPALRPLRLAGAAPAQGDGAPPRSARARHPGHEDGDARAPCRTSGPATCSTKVYGGLSASRRPRTRTRWAATHRPPRSPRSGCCAADSELAACAGLESLRVDWSARGAPAQAAIAGGYAWAVTVAPTVWERGAPVDRHGGRRRGACGAAGLGRRRQALAWSRARGGALGLRTRQRAGVALGAGGAATDPA